MARFKLFFYINISLVILAAISALVFGKAVWILSFLLGIAFAASNFVLLDISVNSIFILPPARGGKGVVSKVLRKYFFRTAAKMLGFVVLFYILVKYAGISWLIFLAGLVAGAFAYFFSLLLRMRQCQ